MDTVQKIKQLASEKNALILVHNYQPPEIQDLADICGDSLELSRRAAETDADVIVFCGVRFMAETAAILSPQKTVVLPDAGAGCPMADMVTADALRAMKQRHPGALTVAYVNSSAETKAECDYCCTSGNALQVARHLQKRGKPIIFVPDRNLGQFIIDTTGVDMILWEGYCPVHVGFDPKAIAHLRREYPGAEVLVHPECPREIAAVADFVLSTGGMTRRPAESSADTFIVGTEIGMRYRLEQLFPHKRFIPAASTAICRDMKKITVDSLAAALETLEPRVAVPEPVCSRARLPLDRMLQIS